MGPGALRQSLAWPLRASLGCVSRLLDLCLELAWVIADASGECRYLCPPRPPKSRALVSCVGALSGSSRLRRSLRGSGYHVTHGQLVSEEGRSTCAHRRRWRLQMPPLGTGPFTALLLPGLQIQLNLLLYQQVFYIYWKCLNITWNIVMLWTLRQPSR